MERTIPKELQTPMQKGRGRKSNQDFALIKQ
jgi:hypothetical protein